MLAFAFKLNEFVVSHTHTHMRTCVHATLSLELNSGTLQVGVWEREREERWRATTLALRERAYLSFEREGEQDREYLS